MQLSPLPTPIVCPKNLMTSPRVAAADALIAPQTAVLHSILNGLSTVDAATATVADVVRFVDVPAFSSALKAANEGAAAVAPEFKPLSASVTQAGDAVVALLNAARTNTSPAELGVGPFMEELGNQFEVMVKGSWTVDPTRLPTT